VVNIIEDMYVAVNKVPSLKHRSSCVLLFALHSETAGNVYTLYEHLYFVTKSILNNTLICILLHLVIGHSKCENIWGSRGIAAVICDLSTLGQLHTLNCFYLEERAPSAHLI
jgi:hypothetical protein